VFGELDSDSAALVQRAILDVLRRRRPERIDVDLNGVTFIDAETVRTLIECQADAHQLGSAVRLLKPHPTVYRVLQVLGLFELPRIPVGR
jgi:anti-sigma B factor antagonist